jgi:acyl homoserine lactone synthase
MIQLITEPWYGEFSHTPLQYTNYDIASSRSGWTGTFKLAATWKLTSSTRCIRHTSPNSDDGRVQGCVRLLPTKGPTMLRDTFPALLNGQPMPMSPQIWESSRFAIDARLDTPKGEHGIACATYELFAGMVEFGLSRHLSDIVTVTDARMERILRRAGWPLRRIGAPSKIGNTRRRWISGYLQCGARETPWGRRTFRASALGACIARRLERSHSGPLGRSFAY